MEKKQNTLWQRIGAAWRRPVCRWLAGWVLVLAVSVFAVYYWRVFFYYDRMPASRLTLLTAAGFSAAYWGFVLITRFVKTLAGRAALLLAVAGAFMCFVTPPIQPPDEKEHFLRAYAISLGRFDFDAERGYPADVDLLVESFPGAYTNGNDGAPIKQMYTLADPDDADSARIASGDVIYMGQQFAAYKAGLAALRAGAASTAEPVYEPVVVMLVPYLHQALAMALARLVGFSALGSLYAARLANLAVYVALAWLALRLVKRWQGAFLAVLFLPIAVYMAASLNYDAILLGLYALAAALLLQRQFTARHLWMFVAAVAVMNIIKPWVNLLWIPGLLFIAKDAWQVKKTGPVKAACLSLGVAAAVIVIFTLYGRLLRFNYGEVGRMLGHTVSPMDQALFILHNPHRTLAVLWGTLTENIFFVPGLGDFGALDTHLVGVAWLSAALLLCGVFASAHGRQLGAKTNVGVGLFALVYTAAVMIGMYITYTPVGMVRVIGLQTRYFIPSVLFLMVLAAQGLQLAYRRAGVSLAADAAEDGLAAPMVTLGYLVAMAAVLCQLLAYYVGPVEWRLLETAAGALGLAA